MPLSRRDFILAGAAAGAAGLGRSRAAGQPAAVVRKPHVITLSFDDGFRKSCARIAAIYEKYRLAACLNVVAGGLTEDAYIQTAPLGDFDLWNELKQRGHEIMPHGYRHENLTTVPLDQAKELVRQCLELFADKLVGFDPTQAIFNLPYNASTPELEDWLTTRVRAFRTGGKAINPLPHARTVKLTCTSFGPGNCEAAIDRETNQLLQGDSGWLIFNAHGLDGEGWGPMRSEYLERLLERLLAMDTVAVLPAGRVLDQYTDTASSGG